MSLVKLKKNCKINSLKIKHYLSKWKDLDHWLKTQIKIKKS